MPKRQRQEQWKTRCGCLERPGFSSSAFFVESVDCVSLLRLKNNPFPLVLLSWTQAGRKATAWRLDQRASDTTTVPDRSRLGLFVVRLQKCAVASEFLWCHFLSMHISLTAHGKVERRAQLVKKWRSRTWKCARNDCKVCWCSHGSSMLSVVQRRGFQPSEISTR